MLPTTDNGFMMLKKIFTRWIAPLAFAVVIALLLTDVVAACPTCKEGLDQSDPQHQSVAAGFYYSILFMMSMPYLILGSFGYLAFVSIRRAKVAQAEERGDGIQGTGIAVS
ncbi:MAG: hypothetical protein AB7G28_09745 [Pirellulales bacterium]